MEERDLLLASLKGYLEELCESGVDELIFAAEPPRAAAIDAPTPATAASAGRVAILAPAASATPAVSPSPAVGLPPASTIEVAGNPGARLCFVMSGCGFTGAAGELLAKMVAAMKFSTADVFLVTFTADAIPRREELLSCLRRLAPEIVVALGEETMQLLLDSKEPVAKLRGRFHEVAGMAIMPTLHPARLLADESLKRQVWSELQQVMRRLQAQWDH